MPGVNVPHALEIASKIERTEDIDRLSLILRKREATETWNEISQEIARKIMRHLVVENERASADNKILSSTDVDSIPSLSVVEAAAHGNAITGFNELFSARQSDAFNIADAIHDSLGKSQMFFSLELFPSKKDDKEDYQRFFSEANQRAKPLFYALTWHEDSTNAASPSCPTLRVVDYFPDNTLVHVAANNLTKFEVVNILKHVLSRRKTNIFVVRGDNCATSGDFFHAVDLVRFIKKNYGSKFVICVAGYPQMHPRSPSKQLDIAYLKAKVDAGAKFIITQFFFESKVLIDFVQDCRKCGITVPIIPGIFPIQNFKSLLRMCQLCKVEIPQDLFKDLLPIKDNDELVRNYGIALSKKLMNEIFQRKAANIFHLFTFNSSSIALDVCQKHDEYSK